MNDPKMNPGASATDLPPATEGADTAEQAVMITKKGDGSFEVQAMAGGVPAGDPIPAASIDEALQNATDTLGGAGNPDQSGDLGAAPNPDAAGDNAAPPMDTGAPAEGETPPSDDEKAAYLAKKGTRPKTAPTWSDYGAGGNPMAK